MESSSKDPKPIKRSTCIFMTSISTSSLPCRVSLEDVTIVTNVTKSTTQKRNHACNEPCPFCHRCHDNQSETWHHCKNCNRHFKNKTCYDLHAKQSDQGNSTCQTYYRCQQCLVTVNKTRTQKPHVCGEKYCKTCKCFKPESSYVLHENCRRRGRK